MSDYIDFSSLDEAPVQGEPAQPTEPAVATPTESAPSSNSPQESTETPQKFTIDGTEFTPDQIKSAFSRLQELESKAEEFQKVGTERQKIEADEIRLRQAIEAQKLLQHPKVLEALAPILDEIQEVKARDPETGQFTEPLSFKDSRITDDLIQQVKDNNALLAEIRQIREDYQINTAWEGVQKKYGDIVDKAFQDRVTELCKGRQALTGQHTTPWDIVTISALVADETGALVKQGRKQILDELKKLPKGAEVIHGNDSAVEVRSEFNPSKYTYEELERDFAEKAIH